MVPAVGAVDAISRTEMEHTMILESIALFPTVVAAEVSIDIDGTIFAQMGWFLLTLLALHFLLFRPYLRTLEARGEAVEGSTEEAGEMGAQAKILEEKYDRKIRKARLDAQEVRDSLRKQGLAEQQDIHGEVRAELDAKLAEEREAIAERVAQAREEIEERAEGLADAMVTRLIAQN